MKRELAIISLLCVVTAIAPSAEPEEGPLPSPEPDGNTMTRPEDCGLQYNALETQQIVSKLVISTDRVEQRKLARELGDRSIAGKIALTREQEAALSIYGEKLYAELVIPALKVLEEKGITPPWE